MDITLTLSDEEEKTLQERAIASGEDVAGYLHRLIDRHVKASASLTDLLAPIRHEFAASGMSEDDLDSLVEEAREKVWHLKSAHHGFQGGGICSPGGATVRSPG